MSELFLPEDQKEKNLLKEFKNPKDNVLVVSAGMGIYALDGFNCEPVFLAKREDTTHDLCLHDGRIYDCGNYNTVCDTLSGEVIYSVPNQLYALASIGNELYMGGEDCAVFNIHQGEALDSERGINAICEFDGDIYYAKGEFGNSYVGCVGSAFKDVRDSPIMGLEVHNGYLYECGHMDVRDVLSGEIVADRRSEAKDGRPFVRSLCSHNGTLYDVGDYNKIFRTLRKMKMFEFGSDLEGTTARDGMIKYATSLISVPRKVLEGYL